MALKCLINPMLLLLPVFFGLFPHLIPRHFGGRACHGGYAEAIASNGAHGDVEPGEALIFKATKRGLPTRNASRLPEAPSRRIYFPSVDPLTCL